MAESYILAGEGSPVLMLHSSMSSKSQWKELVKELSQTHKVIAVDLLGYGGAAFPENGESYSLRDEVEQIGRILDEAGIAADEKIELIGHSFGGATALSWSYTYPDRVKALHVFEPVAFHLLEKPCAGLEQIEGVVTNLHALLEKGDQRGACQSFIDYWSGNGAFASFPPHIQDAMVAQTQKVILDFQALLREPRKVGDYKDFTFPITLIEGTKSPVSSRTIARVLKDGLPQIENFQVECGHMGPITHARQVNEILVKQVRG